MSYKMFIFYFGFLVLGGVGCAKDRRLAPPPNSEFVTVVVKVPAELVAEEMQVMYRSAICTFTAHGPSGQSYSRDGYQQMILQPVRRGQTDIFEAKLPIDGGGYCRWRLSNVTFGVKYEDTKQFGNGVTYSAGGGVVVIFDNNRSPRGGWSSKVDGNLIVKRNYYPWVNERFIGGYRKTVGLAEQGDIYVKYQALNARNVYFEPVLHSKFLVRSVEPKIKREGNGVMFYYPDGSQSPESSTRPSYQKLQAIRLGVEAERNHDW